MRRLRLALRPRHRPRLDGVEAEDTVFFGGRAAEAGELRIGARLFAASMGVAALGVGLPDFDHGVVDRQAVAVEHAALDVDFLTGGVRRNQVGADRFLPVVDRAWFPVAAVMRRQTIGEERADRLRGRDVRHYIFLLRMILSENRFPSPIRSRTCLSGSCASVFPYALESVRARAARCRSGSRAPNREWCSPDRSARSLS